MSESNFKELERLRKELSDPRNADFAKAFLGALYQREIDYPKHEWEYARPSIHSTDQEIRGLAGLAAKSGDYFAKQRALCGVIVEAVKALSLLTP